MNNYIDLLRNILKNFDNNEFDSIIKKILSTLFDDYYVNKNKYIWCIDNLHKKFYDGRYNFIRNKHGSVKNEKLIFRFNRYNKKAYIIKLLKENFRVILDKNENYNSEADIILQKNGIKNYKRYIDNMFMNREIDRNPFIEVELSVKKVCNDNNVVKNKICFYPPYFNLVSGYNYCHLHNKTMI